MNSLDRAFIRAYARDLNVDSLTAAAAQRDSSPGIESRAEPTARQSAPSQTPASPAATVTSGPRRAAAVPAAAAVANEPLVQVSYADGSWYRIEQHESAAANISPPHIACDTKSPAPPPPEIDEDVDLMARFRPPLFRNVNLRSHEHAVAVKAEAIAAQAEAISAPAGDSPKASMPSLDYTLAPPSPPVAPQISLDEIAAGAGHCRGAKIKVAVSPFAELARDKASPPEETPGRLTAQELQDYVAQCRHLQSVVLELASVDDLGSPEEAHVMLVDAPLDLIESETQRSTKKREAEEIARQREAMLTALMQQELIVGDACDPQWIYGSESQGSESQVKAPPAASATAGQVREVPELESPFTSAGDQAPGGQAVLLRSIGKPLIDHPAAAEAGAIRMPSGPAAAATHQAGEESLLGFTHDAVEPMAREVPSQTELPPAEAPAAQTAEPAVEDSTVPEAPPAPASEPLPSAALTPAWEVDRIVWPIMADQLLSDIGDQLQAAISVFRRSPAAPMVAISGHQREEGRTTLAICLARKAAEAGLRVALVDADFTAPSLAQELSLDTMSGWDGVLQFGTLLNEAAIASIDDQLTIVPLEKPLTLQVVTDHIEQLEQALAQLVASFDLVLLDAGPVGELLVEGSWLARLATKPALMLAHDMRDASLLEIQQTIELSQAMGVEVVGVAQTFASEEAA
jgi:Mrp family chromosome partitioning ATPase